MIPPNDVVADLPAPLDDEPPSVRQDIADELADHLACAYRRELFRHADERVAKQQVLDRFGNPQRIAYQLWFQALWGRIMLQRFTRVWQGLKIVAGVAVLFFVFRVAEQQSALNNQLVFLTASNNSMQSQAMGNRLLLEQLLSRLPAPPQPAGDAGGMSAMGMPGMMGAGDMGMGSAAGPSAGMSDLFGGGDGATVAGSLTKPGLKLRLTMQDEKETPASGCYVSVAEEGGVTLSPYNDQSSTDMMSGMGMMSGGFMASAPGMAGGMTGNPSFGGNGKQLKSGAFGYLVSSHMQGTISFAKTLDSRQPPPPFLEPGRYVVSIEFPDGRSGTHRFVVPPSHKAAVHEEHIVCPQGDQKAYVTFHTPVLEESVADAGVHVVAHVMKRPQRLGKSEWQLNRLDPEWTIHFDPVTGAPTGYDITQWLDTPTSTANISTRNVNLSDLSSNERFLGLPAGEYSVQLSWKRADSVGTFEQSSFPAKGAAMDGKLTIDVETRDVLLEMPEAMQEHVQKLLKLAAARSTEATEAPRAE